MNNKIEKYIETYELQKWFKIATTEYGHKLEEYLSEIEASIEYRESIDEFMIFFKEAYEGLKSFYLNWISEAGSPEVKENIKNDLHKRTWEYISLVEKYQDHLKCSVFTNKSDFQYFLSEIDYRSNIIFNYLQLVQKIYSFQTYKEYREKVMYIVNRFHLVSKKSKYRILHDIGYKYRGFLQEHYELKANDDSFIKSEWEYHMIDNEVVYAYDGCKAVFDIMGYKNEQDLKNNNPKEYKMYRDIYHQLIEQDCEVI